MPLRRYSKGMLQRVGLAQALLNEPEVVFLDEPMSGLDPIGRRMVRSLILSLRDRGTTVFFSSHILADAEAICSRVAILAGGRLLSTGKLSEMVAFDVKGWEVVVDRVPEAVAGRDRPARHEGSADRRRALLARMPGERAPRRTRRTARDARCRGPVGEPGARDARGRVHAGSVAARKRARRMILTAVALSVFRESVRDKVFYNLLLFAVLLVAASFLIGQLTAGQDLKIIKDLGLAATSLFGLFIAVFVGIGVVWKEVERRSVYNLLSKPVRRYQLVLGKYLGLLLTLLVNVAVMAGVIYALLAYMDWVLPEGMKRGGRGARRRPARCSWPSSSSSRSWRSSRRSRCSSRPSPARWCPRRSPSASTSSATSTRTSRTSRPSCRRRPLAWVARSLYYLLPNLAPFDIKAQVVHGRTRRRRLRRLDAGVRAPLRHGPARGRLRHLQQAGPEVTPRGRASSAALAVLLVALLGGAVGLEVLRDRFYGEPAPSRTVLYVRSAEAVRRMALSYSRGARRRLLDPGAAVLRRHAGWRQAAPRTTACSTRCSTSPRRSIPASSSRTGSARSSWPRTTPAAPAARTSRSRCSRRASAPTRPTGTTCRTSASSTTGGSATTGRRPGGSRRRPRSRGAPWWMKSLAAVTLAQGGDRASSRLLWQSLLASAENDWLR